MAGTATEGGDYTAVNGTLTFGPGVSSRTITVPLFLDPLDDPGETFSVVLTNPQGSVLGTPNEITVTSTNRVDTGIISADGPSFIR